MWKSRKIRIITWNFLLLKKYIKPQGELNSYKLPQDAKGKANKFTLNKIKEEKLTHTSLLILH